MTDKLSLYNGALGHLDGRRLSSLTQASEARRVLDDYYDGAVAYCLERKHWNFIYRTVLIDASTSVEPAFGYAHAFPIPLDRIRTHQVSAHESLEPALLRYAEEAGYWYADVDPLYVRYNSSDPAYGGDLSTWPQSFVDYVELRLAVKACKRITGSDAALHGPQGLIKREEKAYKTAASICGMNNAIGRQPQGSWVLSRFGAPRGDTPGGSLVG